MLFLLGTIIFTVTLTILLNVFFFKEKQREWIAKYSSWAVIPVWLTLIPILVYHTELVRHTFIFVQWCFIAPQGLGVYYQRKKYEASKKVLDNHLISMLEDAIVQSKKMGAPDDSEYILEYQRHIDEIKNPISFKTKIKNKLKNIF